jgi:flap endonuclease-1
MHVTQLTPAGIKPVYVFEGKPPELKIEQLKQRREKRDEADKELAAAKESGDQEAIEKYSKRTTKVRQHTLSSRDIGAQLRAAPIQCRHGSRSG